MSSRNFNTNNYLALCQQLAHQAAQNSMRLLESLYAMNDSPEEEAIDMIAERINSTSSSVANWFRTRREAERIIYNTLSSTANIFNAYAPTPTPQAPSIFIPPPPPHPSSNGSISSYITSSNRASATVEAKTNHENQATLVASYSNLQQSILESVLAASNNNSINCISNNNNNSNSFKISEASRPQATNSENGLHTNTKTFASDDDDDYLFQTDLNSGCQDLSFPKASGQINQMKQQQQQNTDNNIINFYSSNPFSTLISGKSDAASPTDYQNSMSGTAYKAQPPTVPSSSLLAKLNAVTSRTSAHILVTKLDEKMVELLEAFYAVNDNPEPAAIEMIARRISTTVETIGDWFDEKRLKLNPNAGPRSPPAKKREGGRVVTFSEYQRSLLEAIFDENNYLHPQEYEELSNLIQVPSRNIKIWFKNRRSKQRLSGRINTPGSAINSD